MSGDVRLSAADRLRYLRDNLLRNVRGRRAALDEHAWSPGAVASPGPHSPTRYLTEAFVNEELPRLLKPRRVRVLDIGCGSGRAGDWLAALGYGGEYVGVDMADRFAPSARTAASFETRFVHGDIHEFRPDRPFDLILSISALEHIPHDDRLIDALPGWLAPGGLDLHFVPAGWSLAAYLWHGYRQYGRGLVARRFGPSATSYRLGGAASLALHVGAITVPEMLLRADLRRRFPNFYRRLLGAALAADRALPVAPTFYAVCRKA